jgi:indoleamine 2,3-dioxygenase
MAMVHYSFLVQAYVWGADTPASFLPPALAVPIVALADRLGQQPLLQYSGYVLDNWGRLDPAGGVSLDNIYMIQKFAGGADEAGSSSSMWRSRPGQARRSRSSAR